MKLILVWGMRRVKASSFQKWGQDLLSLAFGDSDRAPTIEKI